VSVDALYAWVFLGPGCVDTALARCDGPECAAVRVEFPPSSPQTWSAWAVDRVGNRSGCVDSADQWLYDPTLPPQPVQLTAGRNLLQGLVPGGAPSVWLYDGPDCVDPSRALIAGAQLAGNGVNTWPFFGDPDGGTVSARPFNSDYPCSAAVVRQ
jgi:hypothetical protein